MIRVRRLALGATAAIATTLAVVVGAPSTTAAPPTTENLGGRLGVAALDAWCREALDAPDAQAERGTVEWRCIGSPGGLFQAEPLDVAAACFERFGPGDWITRADDRGVACSS